MYSRAMLLVLHAILLASFCGAAQSLISCTSPCICLPMATLCDGRSEQDLSNYDNLGEIEPGAFQNADYVTTLDLSFNNPLVLHSESFVGLTNLRNLSLTGNQLSMLPTGVFSPLGNLTKLVLGTNSLSPVEAGWFQGLSRLMTLNLELNGLSTIPADVIAALPELTFINLEFNPLSCENISTVYQLVLAGVADSELKCNVTYLIRELDIDVEIPPTTTIAIQASSATAPSTSLQYITPTPSPTATSSKLIMSSTSRSVLVQISSVLIPSASPMATPTPTPLSCPTETTLNDKGYFDWSVTPVGSHVTVTCPNGPAGVEAGRTCMASGMWGEVDAGGCTEAPVTTQVLADFNNMEVTEESSVGVSEALSSSLPLDQPLSLRDVETFTDIVTQLVELGGGSIEVLNNTLLAINNVLESTGEALSNIENSSAVISELRQLIDTILLDAVDSNHTHLVISFSHLVVEGFYLPPSDEPTLLTIVHEREEEGEEVEVIVEGGAENTTVQVTVYDDTSLFDGSDECEEGEEGLEGVVVTSVVSVSDSANAGGENVTITFNGIHVVTGDSVQCVRWNSGLNCGQGGWETAGCTLEYSTEGVYRCHCQDQGSFSILEVPGQAEATSSGSFHTVAKSVFYGFIGITLPLYLTVTLAILLNRFLYILPTMQSIVAMAISQCLSFIIMAISYERVEFREVCYTLSSIHHYLFLVSLSLAGVYPVLVCIRVFRRMWYEQSWLIGPFVLAATVFPAVFVGVYAGLKYSDSPEDLDICWLEADVFLYFTYTSGIVAILVAMVTITIPFLLACSDYTIEGTLYLQLVSALLNLLLYSAVLACYYLTAESLIDSNYLLMATGALALLCSIHFLIANAVAKSRVRSALMCREDPVLKQKVAHYSGRQCQANEESSSSLSGGRSRTFFHKKLRRDPMRLTDEMNLNYVDSYLGADNPVPLTMLGQVSDAQQGKRVRSKKKENKQSHRLSQDSSVV